MHLGAVHPPAWFAITVVLGETERVRQPTDRSGNILISDVWQYGIRWHRAVFQHECIITNRIPARDGQRPVRKLAEAGRDKLVWPEFGYDGNVLIADWRLLIVDDGLRGLSSHLQPTIVNRKSAIPRVMLRPPKAPHLPK